MVRILGSLALLGWLAGCATAPPPPPAAHTPPPAASAPPATGAAGGTRVGTTASGGTISVNAPVDSTPSADALAVLGTIPEPLGSSPAAESTSVPTPAPTQPLGDKAHASATGGDLAPPPATPSGAAPGPASAGAAGAATGATGGAAGGAAGAGKASAPDSCWRVQVLAPPERDRADRMAQAAQSQLGVPFVVEHESGLYKVRTRDCLSSAAATALRNRAVADGFDGSFRFLKPR